MITVGCEEKNYQPIYIYIYIYIHILYIHVSTLVKIIIVPTNSQVLFNPLIAPLCGVKASFQIDIVKPAPFIFWKSRPFLIQKSSPGSAAVVFLIYYCKEILSAKLVASGPPTPVGGAPSRKTMFKLTNYPYFLAIY